MATSPLNLISTLFLLFALFTLPPSLSQPSPSPSPQPASADNPPPPSPPSPTPIPSPAPSHSPTSPPPSPPSDLPPHPSPASAPAPSPMKGRVYPSPALAADVEEASPSGSGMNGGQKAGIAFGVIAGVCAVGIGALVYKKRKANIQRAEFGYAARREIL